MSKWTATHCVSSRKTCNSNTIPYFTSLRGTASELVFWRLGGGASEWRKCSFPTLNVIRMTPRFRLLVSPCTKLLPRWHSTIFAFKSESCFRIFAFKGALAFKYLLSNRPSPCSPVIMFLLDCDGGWMSSTGHQSRALYVPERLTYRGGLYIKKSAFSQY